MAKAESTARSVDCLNVEYMRSLVKQYSELGQWTSALFWADAAAATGSAAGEASGDDIWLLASALLARGEYHRASHAVTSRGLHKRHLLCLGVAMRAILATKEPAATVLLMEECDPMLLEPRFNDPTHNRALAGILVSRGRALASLDRREAAAEALSSAVTCDAACLEALDLLLEQRALTPSQEMDLIESLPYNSQLGPAEGTFLRAMYRERLRQYSVLPEFEPEPDAASVHILAVRDKTSENVTSRARRLIASCEWAAALKLLDTIDPWCSPELRTACLVELRQSSQLFAFAHTLVDAYPNAWTSWFAVGCYYYLIGKSEFARRYLSKAKCVERSAGCAWLAYGHSFAADNEHDQAMAAYFKASQLMSGCHLPFLYVGVECSLLNNMAMCERFLLKAANVHNSDDSVLEASSMWCTVSEPHVAHEAGVAAYTRGQLDVAENLLQRALRLAAGAPDSDDSDDDMKYLDDANLGRRWAATLDALGHVWRGRQQPARALGLHRRALGLRPRHSPTLLALALNLALLDRAHDANQVLHSALAQDPHDVVANQLLDAVVHSMHSNTTEEDIPQLPFPAVELAPPPSGAPGSGAPPCGAPGSGAPSADVTVMSDMSMSFD